MSAPNPITTEEWRPIAGFEFTYEVSNLGQVRRKPYKSGHCHIKKQCLDKYGYKRLCLSDGHGNYLNKSVHRLVCESFLNNGNPISRHLQTNHKDGNKTNNKLDNLEICTAKENIKHAVKMFGHRQGVKHGMSKITENNVRELRRLYSDKNYSIMKLAQQYKLSKSQIRSIIRRTSWSHVS